MSTESDAIEHVILLHGLCRSGRSMARMGAFLRYRGYRVWNITYPSRRAGIRELSERHVGAAIDGCRQEGAGKIHFVTHSMGGILVRSFCSRHSVPNLGRVVMLGPPNQGSEVVDRLRANPLFRWLNGPAGQELGTGPDSTPNQLGAAGCEVGIIAGDRSVNWINSAMIQGPDDGKVSVEKTKLKGMADHVVVHVSHPFLMRNRAVMELVDRFLKEGKFEPGQR